MQCEASWDTLCSSDGLLDVGVHWQEVESHGDQGCEDSGSGGCPGGMQLKARSVTGVASEPEISSVVTVVRLNAPLGLGTRRDSSRHFGKSLEKVSRLFMKIFH